MRAIAFWRYYGGKWRAAPRYPKPRYTTIVEPFAGAAGYSMLYPATKNVVLIEKYYQVAEIWRYLIAATPEDIRRIPVVEHVDALPAWVPEGARYLVGFNMNTATATPRKQLSAGRKKASAAGRHYEGWTEARRATTAWMVEWIKHWTIIEGDYTAAPDVEATWFIDPPYNCAAGRHYKHHDIDYRALGEWCRSRRGQVIVCENVGATWLPFREMFKPQSTMGRDVPSEAIWLNDWEAR